MKSTQTQTPRAREFNVCARACSCADGTYLYTYVPRGSGVCAISALSVKLPLARCSNLLSPRFLSRRHPLPPFLLSPRTLFPSVLLLALALSFLSARGKDLLSDSALRDIVSQFFHLISKHRPTCFVARQYRRSEN